MCACMHEMVLLLPAAAAGCSDGGALSPSPPSSSSPSCSPRLSTLLPLHSWPPPPKPSWSSCSAGDSSTPRRRRPRPAPPAAPARAAARSRRSTLMQRWRTCGQGWSGWSTISWWGPTQRPSWRCCRSWVSWRRSLGGATPPTCCCPRCSPSSTARAGRWVGGGWGEGVTMGRQGAMGTAASCFAPCAACQQAAPLCLCQPCLRPAFPPASPL